MTPEIVAELSSNHGGLLARAMVLIRAAKDAGCDAVKFQCWTPDTMVLDEKAIATNGPWSGMNLRDLYRHAHTPWGWFPELIAHAERTGIPWFSSVFDVDALTFLESLDCPRYKISSFELVDLALVEKVAATGKPLIMSTGMAAFGDIDAAVDCALDTGLAIEKITLLKCTSAYPAPANSVNLAAMPQLGRLFATRYGLSDHTEGVSVAVAASIMGAEVIEKHLKLSNDYPSLDASFSITPETMRQLVTECRRAKDAIGMAAIGCAASEMPSLSLRRWLYWARDIKSGSTITADDLCTARYIGPGMKGTPPALLPTLIGRHILQSVKKNTPVSPAEMFYR